MIVVDASATIDLLIGTRNAATVRGVLGADLSWHAPELLDVESLHVLRRWRHRGWLDSAVADRAVDELEALPLTRHTHGVLRRRVWQLRDRCTAYDATYVALAEALDATLVTTDARLAQAAADVVDVRDATRRA